MGARVARLLAGLALLLGLGAAALVLLPAPIDPLAWEPPEKPRLAGVLAPNQELARARLLGRGRLQGPEDVALDAEGRIYAGTLDGRIHRILADGRVEEFATTGGRPLGLAFDASGRLLACVAGRGLLAIDGQGRVTTLAEAAGGVRLGTPNALDVASDGRIYFSDASTRFPLAMYLFDLLEARPHGRLLRYDPATGATEVLLEGLYFANGVALSRAEDFVVVAETYRYRIRRYWLAGAKAGQADVFADNLPCIPDGISGNRRGRFWLAAFTVRNDAADRLLHPRPWLKRALTHLPRALWPKPEPYGLILALDEQGQVRASLHEPTGRHVRQVTAVKEHAGALYFGTLEGDWVGRYELPENLR